ncbi:uncharacterized protein LOC109809957 [Cajanus cajan]|uniref:Uncharacterized protein n=1 Tax=Cajanus cajan TaxID=3821 RepID=A0A151ST41_CAJCA|nr:uncharacterized protein LOC109809957 [Cajanus cajan]KYP57931.1 hypothetical protein KK1_004217 [Cajanus cajan]
MSTIHQTHTRQESEGDKEFSFWGSSNTIPSQNNCDRPQGNETRHNKKADFGETYQRKNIKLEYSSSCSSISDPSRHKAVAEGQRELMEMMQDIPESGYELSFQDMVVVDKQVLGPEQPHQSETSYDNTLMQSSGSKVQLKRLNKKKNRGNNSRPGQILRVESMDSETFLLKLFFPISLDWMKKDKVKSGSKISPRPSLQESMKQLAKEWRIKRFFLSGNNRDHAGDGKIQNSDRSNSDISRYVDHSFSLSHGCCPFPPYAKSKTKNLGE